VCPPQKKVNPFDAVRKPGTIKSPPGVKTRATRRSSIYQRAGKKMVSPPTTRARRASMYVRPKGKEDPLEIFSKVWATPAKLPEPIKEVAVAADEKKPKSLKKMNVKEVHKVLNSSTEGNQKSLPMTTPKRTARALNDSKSKEMVKTPAVKATPKSAAQKKSAKVVTSTPSKAADEVEC